MNPILKERKQILKERRKPIEKSSSLEEIRKKKNNKINIIDKDVIEEKIQETQELLDEIDKNVIEEKKQKNVKFNIPDDTKSEISDGSDLDLDLESFEKSLLED